MLTKLEKERRRVQLPIGSTTRYPWDRVTQRVQRCLVNLRVRLDADDNKRMEGESCFSIPVGQLSEVILVL